MLYFKSTLVGLFTACIAIAIVVVAMIRLSYGEGSGAIYLSMSSWQILSAGLVGFAAGFWLMLRRGHTLVRNV